MKRQSLNKIDGYIEMLTTHKVECGICGADWSRTMPDERDPADLKESAKELMDKGWREVNSEEYQSIMLLCPICTETQLKKKGEKLA